MIDEQDVPVAAFPLDWTVEDTAFRRIVWMASAPLDPIEEDQEEPPPA